MNYHLRDQLIEKLPNFELKRKLLEHRNITLEEALNIFVLGKQLADKRPTCQQAYGKYKATMSMQLGVDKIGRARRVGSAAIVGEKVI